MYMRSDAEAREDADDDDDHDVDDKSWNKKN